MVNRCVCGFVIRHAGGQFEMAIIIELERCVDVMYGYERFAQQITLPTAITERAQNIAFANSDIIQLNKFHLFLRENISN